MLMKSIKIGNVLIKNNAFLAPMAGFSNIAMRKQAYEYGAGLTYTEMISAKALAYDNDKTKQLLVHDDNHPIAVQIFGSDPKVMADVCASGILDDFDIIDINMGCPTPKIIKNGDGSALLKNIDLAREIIEACVKASKKPITVKFRIGVDESHIIATEFAKMCEEAGASAITVHGRTVSQGYSGKSNLEIIKQVKNAVNIPVIASGDCIDKQSFDEILKKTGVDVVMIGRAAIGNPEIFAEVLGNKVVANKIEQIYDYVHTLEKYYSQKVVVLTMRGIACHYLKHIKNTSAIRAKISQINSLNELYELLNQVSC